MKAALSLLDEALVLFFRAVKRHFWTLFALFLPVNLLTVYLHCQKVQSLGSVPWAAIKPEGTLEQVNGLVLGVLAALLIVRTVWRLTERPTDANVLFESAPGAWRQAFGTQLLTLAAVFAAVFIPLAATSLMARYLIPGQPPVFAPLMLLLGVVFMLLALLSLCRWMLAIPLSLLFGLSALKATDASRRMLDGRFTRALGLMVLAWLVAVGMSCIPEALRYCDLLGFWHPFTTLDTSGCVVVGLLLVVMGTLSSLAHLYVWAVLTVYIRDKMEGPVAVGSFGYRRTAVLACFGLLFVSGIIYTAVRHDEKPDECRIFRMENMNPDEEYAKAAWKDVPRLCLFYLLPPTGHCYLEKRTVMEKDSVFWVEMPFCSHCGEFADSLGDGCEADVFALKCVILENYVPGKRNRTDSITVRWSSFRLLPTDVQRKMTDEERACYSRRKEPNCKE